MKRSIPALFVFFSVCTVFAADCQAVVAVSETIKSNATIRNTKSARSESTGFFGGIKNGNRLLLILSPGSVMYFGINNGTRALIGGRTINVSQIPENAHVRLTSERGVVVEVVVMEDNK
jgi:hypothetical protein